MFPMSPASRNDGRPDQDSAPENSWRAAGFAGQAEHVEAMREHAIEPIDMVVVNLYPFSETIMRDNVTEERRLSRSILAGPR
jgi:hypothetical protein